LIVVVRLGERPERDHRINTHLALVARAFGAERLVVFFRDQSLLSSLSAVNNRFGGKFEVEVRPSGSWKKVLREWDGAIVHLTMYGIPLDEGLGRLSVMPNSGQIMVVVGGEKVPAGVYGIADLNIAVGNQPHSEVAALAVFLDRYLKGSQLELEMEGWTQRIVPQERGKKVIGPED